MLWDDQNVIGLKVKLMEQAKKLAALHNRVTNVQTQCQQLLDSPFKDLVKEEEALGVRSLLEKRKLLLRLCDLEEQILCAEIGSQHTSIDSFVLLQGLKEIRNTVHDELQQEFSLPPMSFFSRKCGHINGTRCSHSPAKHHVLCTERC